jgi:hypothetical protein
VERLLEFVALCPSLKAVVAIGGGAQEVAAHAWHGGERDAPPLIDAPHPMIYGRGGAERAKELASQLQRVAQLVAA